MLPAMLMPALAKIAQEQYGVFRRAQALANGYDAATVDRLKREGSWVVVRHGVYATVEQHRRSTANPRLAHLLEAAARRLVMAGDVVISHGSAAIFHGIALLDSPPPQPQLTRHRPDGVAGMTAHDLYVAPVPRPHRNATVPVTSAARTVADCARSLGRAAALVSVESALHLGLDRLAVADVLRYCSGWPGAAEALDVLMFASPWSESPLESLARHWFLQLGLPLPTPQRVVRELDGRFLARVDFVWPQYRTVCEMDGQVKYVAKEDTRLADRRVVWQEKRRQDRLGDVGLEVVRGYWDDVADGGTDLAGRLRRAFARGMRQTGEPLYRLLPPSLPAHRPLAVPAAQVRARASG